MADRRCHLLGVAASGVAGGEYSFKAGLYGPTSGDEARMSGVKRVPRDRYCVPYMGLKKLWRKLRP